MGNSSSAQRARLLAELRNRTEGITMLEAHKLGILRVGARIFELRRRGFRIATHWCVDHDSEGRPHRVARYILLAGGPQE